MNQTHLVWFKEDARFVDTESVIILRTFVQVDHEFARLDWIGALGTVVAIVVVVGVSR